jgi:drug/metabolite transporter (DMT)-like permease
MTTGSEFAAVAFGLASAATFGIGDFIGGVATRRTSVRTVVIISHAVGLILMVVLAIFRSEPAPLSVDIFWGAAAGIVGQIGVVALYQAMAIGQMGIAAPVTAVLSAALPALVGTLTQGLPDLVHLIGFALALIGVWTIARPEGTAGRPAGIGLALVGGLCFGGFFVLLAQIHKDAIFWPLAVGRLASVILQLAFALVTRSLVRPTSKLLPLIVVSGVMDVAGNVFFVLAEQSGRLDVAGVLASLYPATTVLLAFWILKERMTRIQRIGVMLALVAVPLIAAK